VSQLLGPLVAELAHQVLVHLHRPGLLVLVSSPNSEVFLEDHGRLSEGPGHLGGCLLGDDEFGTAESNLGETVVSCSMQLDTFWLPSRFGLIKFGEWKHQ